MKDWIGYCRTHVNEDLWGLIVLDYYHNSRKAQNSAGVEPTQPADFLKAVVNDLADIVKDPVAFHRVLLSISAQLLHPLDKAFVLSAYLIEVKQIEDSGQIAAIAEHYRVYGRHQDFMSYRSASNNSPNQRLETTRHVEPGEHKTHPDVTTIQPDLQARIEDALRDVYGPKVNLNQEKYLGQFARSGTRKGELLLGELDRKLDGIDASQLAVVSIGGADGSEIEYLLRNGRFNYGILIEYMHVAITSARLKAAELEKHGKHLEVFEGDASQKLNDCNEQLLKWKAEGRIVGVIYSVNALIHEMKTRTPGFDLRDFIHEIARDWKPLILSIREPCSPEKWPPQVELKVPGVSGDTLKRFADAVSSKCKITSKISSRSADFVLMSARLAIEVLFKMFYLEDLDYELEESVTSFKSQDLRTALELEFQEDGQVAPIYLNSDSFNELFRKYGVQCRDVRGQALRKPVVFLRLIASRL